jgi:hypothetical protein
MYLNTNRNRSQLKPLRRREIKSCFNFFFSNRNWISQPAKTSFGFILITGCKESLRDHHHLWRNTYMHILKLWIPPETHWFQSKYFKLNQA